MALLTGLSTRGEWMYIDVEAVADMLKNGLDKVLLIDSRSFLEYNTSRIQQSVNICCSKLAKHHLQEDKISIKDLLAQLCHIEIEEYSDIIVYDQVTADVSQLSDDNFLVILLRKLKSSPTINNVALLKGGFLAFQAMQPQLCENKTDNSYKCTALTFLSQPCLPVSNVGPTRILPFLYLGSHRDAISQETIQVNDISFILNVSTTCPKPPFVQEGHFFRIPINDNYSAKMLPYFEEAFQFIDKVREANGCVLVHCLAGISRSPTLAIAYIMRHLNMSSDDAYRYVKDKRPTISPNFNFLGQLLEYEKQIRKGKDYTIRHKLDNNVLDIKPKSIIAMDLQMTSPSSPKISKSFTFDSLWDTYSLTKDSQESKECKSSQPLLRDSDTWEDFTTADKIWDKSKHIQLSSNETNNNDQCQKEVVTELKNSKTMASTPCEEFKPFPQFVIPPEHSPALDGSRRSPKSPSNRSFTLPLSSETKELRSFSLESSFSRSRLKSPRQALNRPFTLPLSPVISPEEENSAGNSPVVSKELTISEKFNETTSTPSSISTTLSKKSFSLSLSTCQPVANETHVQRTPTPKSGRIEERQNQIDLNSKTKDENVSKTVPLPIPFPNVSNMVMESATTNTSSVFSSCVQSTSINISHMSPKILKKEFECATDTSYSKETTFTSHSDYMNKTSVATSVSHSSFNTEQSELHTSSKSHTNISSCSTKGMSQLKRPSFSLALSTVISPEATPMSCRASCDDKPSTKLDGNLVSSPQYSTVSNISESKFFVPNTDKGIHLRPIIPKTLSLQEPEFPNKKLCMSQKMSPSSAMARLNFMSPTTSEPKSIENQNLQNFPSTSLDQLNFTPCFANSYSKLSRKKTLSSNFGLPSEIKDNIPDNESPTSHSGSSSTETITSPSSTFKVVRRSHENRAKRPMERPNSIAFSKYPIFDLGSDCLDSPGSVSSTSQDDASEMYILQNGKRSKHSDSNLGISHYSEKEIYKQISAAMESAMLRTKVYEASRKARSMDDILSSDEQPSPSRSPFGRHAKHCIMDGCRGTSDPYQSNSSISSSSSHNSLQGSLEIIQASPLSDEEYMI